MKYIATIDPTAIEIFGWPIQWYGIIIGIAMIVAYWLIQRESQKQGLDSEHVSDIIFWAILFGFIGARIYYVIFQWEYYQQHPEDIIKIWQGGIAVYGGVIAGALTTYVLAKRYKIPVFQMTDIAAPALLIAQAIGRWGNFINQEAHGGQVSRQFLEQLHLPKWLIDQMFISGNYYHPTFLYESLWNFLGAIVMLVARRKIRGLKPGQLTAGYFIWYGLGRAWIEGLRTDSLYLGTVRVSQVLSIILVIVGMGVMYWINQKSKTSKNTSLK